MNLTKVARRTEAKYGRDIAQLLGVPQRSVTYSLGQLNGAAAETRGQAITIDKDYFESKKDLRGAIVHELAHAYMAVPGNKVPSKWVEGTADYARAELTKTPGWKPNNQVRALQRVGEDRARRFASLAAQGKFKEELVAYTNGPRAGRGSGRARTGGTNRRSKGGNANGAYAPPLPPGQSWGFAQQIAALQQGYGATLAGIQAEVGAVKSQKLSALGDIREQRIAGAAAAESDALSRGIGVGSSAHLEAQGANIATAAGAKVDVRSQTSAALAALRAQKMGAQSDLMLGVAGVQADKAAAQAELANQRYMQDLIATQTESYQSLYKDALKKILAAKGRDPKGADGKQVKHGSFTGTEEEWQKLGRDEKFRYMIASAPYTPPTNAGWKVYQ